MAKKANSKRKDPVKIAMMAFTVLILVGSALGIMLSKSEDNNVPDNSFMVGEYQFFITNAGDYATYFSTTGGQMIPIAFRLDPRYASNISIEQDATTNILTATKVYSAYNPNTENIPKTIVAVGEVARLIPLVTGLTVIDAYTEDATPVNPDVPLRTCKDAVGTTAVIVYEVTDETQVISDGNCVRVQGSDYDELILAADKFGMNLLGLNL